MPFNIQPIREFVVRPALPPQLSRMSELAYNILWAWEPSIRTLFRRLDPALWKESGYNPVVMLGRVSQSTLERAAADPRYIGPVSARLPALRRAHAARIGRRATGRTAS